MFCLPWLSIPPPVGPSVWFLQPLIPSDNSCITVKTKHLVQHYKPPPTAPQSYNNRNAKICGSLSLNYFTAKHVSSFSFCNFLHNLATLRTGVNVELLVASVLNTITLKDYSTLAQMNRKQKHNSNRTWNVKRKEIFKSSTELVSLREKETSALAPLNL